MSVAPVLPQGFGEALTGGPLLSLDDQLPARRADVAAAALAHRTRSRRDRRGCARRRRRARPTGGRTGMPAAALSGIRFTFALMPASSRASRRASSSESLTPSSSTYSNVIRLRFLTAETAGRPRGCRAANTSSSAARWRRAAPRWSRGARSPGSASASSCASLSSIGTRPTVDSVTRRGPDRQDPCSSLRMRSAFIVCVVVVQRFAHAHQDDIEGLSCKLRARARGRATWPAISPAVRCRTRPILPVRQNAQPIAQPTCVEMQKVCAGVSGMNTDSMCWPSASRRTNFWVPSSETSRRAMSGVSTVNCVGEAGRAARGSGRSCARNR